MKKNIHPQMNPILFIDESTGKEIQSWSTITSDETKEIDGVKYFVIRLDVTSFSHPFFTGEMRFVDRQGRVDKFRQKMAKAKVGLNNKKAKKAKKQANDVQDVDRKSYREILREKQSGLRETNKTSN